MTGDGCGVEWLLFVLAASSMWIWRSSIICCCTVGMCLACTGAGTRGYLAWGDGSVENDGRGEPLSGENAVKGGTLLWG